MHREPDVGFDPGSPGWCPGPKAGTKPLRHPGIPETWVLMPALLLAPCVVPGNWHPFLWVSVSMCNQRGVRLCDIRWPSSSDMLMFMNRRVGAGPRSQARDKALPGHCRDVPTALRNQNEPNSSEKESLAIGVPFLPVGPLGTGSSSCPAPAPRPRLASRQVGTHGRPGCLVPPSLRGSPAGPPSLLPLATSMHQAPSLSIQGC